jgi:hypothetical protein
MKREIGFPLTETVPRAFPPASTYRWPNPCTWISRLHANVGSIVKFRSGWAAADDVGAAPGTRT